MLSICGGGQNTLLDGVQQVFNALRRFRKLFFQKGNVGVLPPLEVHQLVRQRLHDGIIDEWGAFIMALEKKEAKQLKRKLAELLMLGRAYQFFPIVGVQRSDAAYFASARDKLPNLSCAGQPEPGGTAHGLSRQRSQPDHRVQEARGPLVH